MENYDYKTNYHYGAESRSFPFMPQKEKVCLTSVCDAQCRPAFISEAELWSILTGAFCRLNKLIFYFTVMELKTGFKNYRF